MPRTARTATPFPQPSGHPITTRKPARVTHDEKVAALRGQIRQRKRLVIRYLNSRGYNQAEKEQRNVEIYEAILADLINPERT